MSCNSTWRDKLALSLARLDDNNDGTVSLEHSSTALQQEWQPPLDILINDSASPTGTTAHPHFRGRTTVTPTLQGLHYNISGVIASGVQPHSLIPLYDTSQSSSPPQGRCLQHQRGLLTISAGRGPSLHSPLYNLSSLARFTRFQIYNDKSRQIQVVERDLGL